MSSVSKELGPVSSGPSVFNRAEVIDVNFTKLVLADKFPVARSSTDLHQAGLSPQEFLDLFESQMMSRHLDLRARILKNDNQCFYTIGSSGHEGNAGVAFAFQLRDMAFLHYRSGAFMIQRAKQLEGSTPLYDNLLSFVAAKEEPIAGGRHKVFGSLPLNVPPQTSTIASHLPKAVGAALSIGRAKDLALAEAKLDPQSVVLCSFGDASANHSTAVGAINMASWVACQNLAVPIVFVCEDNQIGISVPTPQAWIEKQYSQRPDLHYIFADGLNLCDVVAAAREAEEYVRVRRKPVFLHIKTVRLLGHAGSDVETSYRSLTDIESVEFNDPLLHSARICREQELLSSRSIVDLYETVRTRVERISREVVSKPKITDPQEIASSITACEKVRRAPAPASENLRKDAFGRDFHKLGQPQHLAKLLNYALTDLLLQYPGTVIFGEDVAQKGGVYNVTEGLYKKFGPRRVFNSLLDEQSILGTAIGMAHNGFVPLPEIQFLAYFHNAEDQIRGEAATLAFFSQGQFTNPMVVRIAGLPYQKGFGGHFHNDNSLAIFRDIPGLILAVPARGDDAAMMLRTCVREAYEKGRVVVFVEPIALYMTKDLHVPNDKQWSFVYPSPDKSVPLGEPRIYPSEKPAELLIITYGNGVYYSLQAVKKFTETQGVGVKVLDLRWLMPLNIAALIPHLENVRGVLIVDECRKSGSLSEQLLSGLYEHTRGKMPLIRVEAALDCFIPLGVAAAAGLPSCESILKQLETLHSEMGGR
jgi:2-oxoisovalerate dehydrogenase E1 component